MAMSRMNRVNLMTRGKSGGEKRGRDEESYEREYNRSRSGGMDSDRGRNGWENDERQGKRMNYDDNYEEGGGRYAGNFRHSQNPRKHEAGEDDENEVEIDEHAVKKWVAGMRNNDGTTGEHFKPEIADQLRTTLCPGCDKTEFWAAMNMVYSDYCDVFKKLNVDRPETYAHMAKAFLADKDAGEGKLAKYMKYVAGK